MTAEELRALKCSVAMSAEELGRAAGYSRTTIRRWLRGERLVSPRAARRLREVVDRARRRLIER